MKRQLVTIGILLFCGLGLGAYIYFYEIKHTAQKEKQAEAAKKLLTLSQENLAKVRVVFGGQDYTLAKGAGNTWSFVQPFAAPAKKDEVERLVDRVLGIKQTESIGKEKNQLTDFGLAPAHVQISLWTTGNNLVNTIYVGERTPAGDNAYVMTQSDSVVYLVAADLLFAVEKKMFDLRDRDLVSFERDNISKMDIMAHAQKPMLLKREADFSWALLLPVVARAKRDELDKMLDKLVYNKAESYVAEDAPDLATYGLANPRLRITVWDKTDQMTVLLVGNQTSQNDKTYYAKRLDRRPVFTVAASVMESFDRKPDDLRDKAIIDFEKENVNSLKAANRGITYAFSHDAANAWQMDQPKTVIGKEPDNRVNELLEALKGLEWKTVVTDNPAGLAAYGLEPVVWKVDLWFNKGASRTLLFGTIGDQKENLYYCQLAGSRSVYLVAQTPVEKLELSSSLGK